MKNATLIVIKKPHRGGNVIENVLGYMLDSMYADYDEMLVNHVRTDTFEHMAEDMYKVQNNANMEKHRRVFHFVLSTRPSKVSQTVVTDGAYALLGYLENLGHQAVMVPHYGSKRSIHNFHYHVAVNPISYTDGSRMLDKWETFYRIACYLSQYTVNNWTWRYSDSVSVGNTAFDAV